MPKYRKPKTEELNAFGVAGWWLHASALRNKRVAKILELPEVLCVGVFPAAPEPAAFVLAQTHAIGAGRGLSDCFVVVDDHHTMQVIVGLMKRSGNGVEYDKSVEDDEHAITMDEPVSLTIAERDNLVMALIMRINYIQTGDTSMDVNMAKGMGKEKQIKSLSPDQMRLIADSHELLNKLQGLR